MRGGDQARREQSFVESAYLLKRPLRTRMVGGVEDGGLAIPAIRLDRCAEGRVFRGFGCDPADKEGDCSIC